MTTESSGSGAWTEPGLELVAPGVFRVPLPLPNDGLRAVNVYVLQGEDGLTLIDAGWAIPEARELLITALKTLDATPGDIDRFLVTHAHRDHYTQAVALRREFGTPVALGRDERETLEIILGPSFSMVASQRAAALRNGARELTVEMARFSVEPSAQDRSDFELPDEWLHDGVTVRGGGRSLEVVETPGHTRGHVVFHDLADRLLFAGDHVLPTITPSIGLEAATVDNPLGSFMTSLALVRSRPDALLLPAHGPVAASVHDRVDELVAHHGRRLDATEAAVRSGSTTAYEVAQRLSWTRRERAFAELDLFNRVLATGETAAHLRLLEAQSWLTASEDDTGVLRYLPA